MDKILMMALRSKGGKIQLTDNLELIKHPISGGPLFPELTKHGPMRPLKIMVNAGNMVFMMNRGPNGHWCGIVAPPNAAPERLEHLACFGLLKYIVNEGLVEDIRHS